MTDILDNTATTATLAIGTLAASTIDTLGDHDWFRVNLIAGHTYVFTLDSTDVLGGTPLDDPDFGLWNAAGTLLAYNDDFVDAVIVNSQIDFTATTSGATISMPDRCRISPPATTRCRRSTCRRRSRSTQWRTI